MKSSIEFSADGRMNTKLARMQNLRRTVSLAAASEAYKSNSTKEELCYEYITSFTRQFESLNPHRRKLYMIPENEYGTKKFVCSTIRPTQVPFSELYDMYECASFLAGYILYEPLELPRDPPIALFSPTQTLDSHTGDSFDIATLLCSFLIGNGYDAFVVWGYAPRFITLRDQSMTQCPVSTETVSSASAPIKLSQDTKQDIDDQRSSYVASDYRVKGSSYIAEEAEKKRLAALDTFKLWIHDELPASPETDDAESRTARTHAWVLVCPGKREVREPVFLEPSTGRAYSATNSPYLGIESVWNNTNYWVNNVVDKKISEIDYDLRNAETWEYLFVTSPKTASAAAGAGEEDGDGVDGGDKAQEESKAKSAASALTRAFDAPPTWVSILKMDRKKYLMRYPPAGKRTIQYFKAKLDYFARGVNSQSMMMRVVLYLDKTKTIVSEIHEWFESRKDKMFKRVRYFLGQTKFIEYYQPGSVGEVKQWVEYPGKKTEIDFYVNGRLDRMARREELIGQKVTEYYEGRPDRLIFRSVDLTVDKSEAGARQFVLAGGTLAPEIFVLKMTQSFDTDPTVEAGTDIAMRTFFVREGKAIVRYHFAKSQVTNRVKTFFHTRGPSVPEISEVARSQEVGIEEDVEFLQEAVTLERECYAAVKANFQQMQKIQEFRNESEAIVVPQPSVFDVALDRAVTEAVVATATSGSSERSAPERDMKGTDYLTPFLRNLKDPQRTTKEEALEVRQHCLDALKARLVERANIIQSRLNDENAKLGRKQEQFQRSQREGELSTEEYEKYCTEAMFRIQILEQRLVAHEDAALKKFAELDGRLANDPRLRVLRNP